MTPTQRQAIELAISDFEHISAAGGRVEFVERRIAALRAALAEPAPVQEPVHGDILPPIGSRVFIRHGRDDGAHACTVTGYYAWPDLGRDKRLTRLFVRMVYEGTKTQQARMLCDCFATEADALAAPQAHQPAPPADVPIDADLSDSDYATIAGLEASIGHLSRLVDEQRELIAQLTNVPMLTAYEQLQIALDCNMRIRAWSGAVKFATAIEQAVRQKAGLQ